MKKINKRKEKKIYIVLAFILSITACFFTALMPKISFLPFAPFLVVLFLHKPFSQALWGATLTGTFLDLFSSQNFGFYSFSYCLTALFLYKQKRFFNEKPLSFSIFTYFVSLTLSLLHLFLFFLFKKNLPVTFLSFTVDIFAMPLLDVLLAFFWVALPLQAFEMMRKKTRHFFLKRRMNLDDTE